MTIVRRRVSPHPIEQGSEQMVLDAVRRAAGGDSQDVLDAGDGSKPASHLIRRRGFAQAVHVRPGVDREAYRQPVRAPGADGVEDRHGGRLPVEQGRIRGHHHRVHGERIRLDDGRQRCEVAGLNGSPDLAQAFGNRAHPRGMQRAGVGQRVPLRRADRLMRDVDDRDHVSQVPMLRRRDAERVRSRVVRPHLPLDVAAGHAAARRPGACPRQPRQRPFVEIQPGCGGGRDCQRRESRRRRGQPCARREVVEALDARVRAGAGHCAGAFEHLHDAVFRRARLFPPAEDDDIFSERIVERDGRRRRQAGHVHRQGGVGREAQQGIAVAPVFNEGDIRECLGCCFPNLHVTQMTFSSFSTASVPRRSSSSK